MYEHTGCATKPLIDTQNLPYRFFCLHCNSTSCRSPLSTDWTFFNLSVYDADSESLQVWPFFSPAERRYVAGIPFYVHSQTVYANHMEIRGTGQLRARDLQHSILCEPLIGTSCSSAKRLFLDVATFMLHCPCTSYVTRIGGLFWWHYSQV